MKVIVFGSTSDTGRQLVELALAQGHTVTAFARNAADLESRHSGLALVPGDVPDAGAVEAVGPAQEAVLCALGAPAVSH